MILKWQFSKYPLYLSNELHDHSKKDSRLGHGHYQHTFRWDVQVQKYELPESRLQGSHPREDDIQHLIEKKGLDHTEDRESLPLPPGDYGTK